jgi:hypothetical protein
VLPLQGGEPSIQERMRRRASHAREFFIDKEAGAVDAPAAELPRYAVQFYGQIS